MKKPAIKKSDNTQPTTELPAGTKRRFRLVEEPMSDSQVMEWWIFAGGMVGIVAGLLLDRIGLCLLLGATFGLLSSLLLKNFKKQ